MKDVLFTPSGVRLQRHSVRAGSLNWLLLPGGPGIGSESLDELAATLDVPGTVWLVDLPGDGSNQDPTGCRDPFSAWPQVVIEAAQALPNVVFAGHSTGGMYLLSTPELERHIRGLILIDTAPDARWHPHYVAMTLQSPLPAVEAATAVYELDPQNQNLAAVAVASAEWNFTPDFVAAGRELLARMPYCSAAVDWSDRNFDHVYQARWWPQSMPVLIIAGADDRIVWQGGWEDERFHTPNVVFEDIPKSGHFPWIDNPAAVRSAFAAMAKRIGVA